LFFSPSRKTEGSVFKQGRATEDRNSNKKVENRKSKKVNFDNTVKADSNQNDYEVQNVTKVDPKTKENLNPTWKNLRHLISPEDQIINN
jgi:hypothetical protein